MQVSDLLGKTLVDVVGKKGESEMLFICSDLSEYRLYHNQDCCESVTIEDICGDLGSLVGSPITMAGEEVSNVNPLGVQPEYQDSFTWTFYKFATVNGYVTIRWYGSSNGYYSEKVEFDQIK